MATGITETDVWQAADALLLEGLRPTIERVRQKIGRGSPNTVSPYLETWFKCLGARIKDPGAFSAPTSLPDPIHQAAKHFWETALAAVRADLDHEASVMRADLEEERQRLQDVRNAFEARQMALEGQLRALAEAAELARIQGEEARARVAQLEGEMQRSASGLDQARADLRDLQARLQSERDQWATDRRELESRYQANEQHWSVEVDRAREAAKRAEVELTRERAAFTKQLAGARDQAKAMDAQAHATGLREQTYLNDLEKLRSEAEALRKELIRNRDAHSQRENELLQRALHGERQLDGALRQLREKGSELAHLVRSLVEQNPARGKRALPKR